MSIDPILAFVTLSIFVYWRLDRRNYHRALDVACDNWKRAEIEMNRLYKERGQSTGDIVPFKEVESAT